MCRKYITSSADIDRSANWQLALFHSLRIKHILSHTLTRTYSRTLFACMKLTYILLLIRVVYRCSNIFEFEPFSMLSHAQSTYSNDQMLFCVRIYALWSQTAYAELSLMFDRLFQLYSAAGLTHLNLFIAFIMQLHWKGWMRSILAMVGLVDTELLPSSHLIVNISNDRFIARYIGIDIKRYAPCISSIDAKFCTDHIADLHIHTHTPYPLCLYRVRYEWIM